MNRPSPTLIVSGSIFLAGSLFILGGTALQAINDSMAGTTPAPVAAEAPAVAAARQKVEAQVAAAASAPPAASAQQIVDSHEIKMRWTCEDAIKAQLRDPRSYEAEEVRYQPHDSRLNEHPDQVVDVHVSFRSRNGFGGMAGGFGRCGFNASGELVRTPNVVSN